VARAAMGRRARRDTTFDADRGATFSAGGRGLRDRRSGGPDCDSDRDATHRCGENGVHAKASDLRLRDERGHSLVVLLAPLVEGPRGLMDIHTVDSPRRACCPVRLF